MMDLQGKGRKFYLPQMKLFIQLEVGDILVFNQLGVALYQKSSILKRICKNETTYW
jgi:hypothetical protein